MHRKVLLTISVMLTLVSAVNAKNFWLGADISGTTGLEAHGVQLYNVQGEKCDNFQLMKAYGLDAVRLRVWVNPKDGFCSKEDVLKMARRAKELGMAVMIDFHYSDWWADPANQNIPVAWEEMDYDQMRQALAQHTRETLELLKVEAIDVRWVQIGNETTHGFLWPMGRAEENMAQYAGLTQAGYDAVKTVFPDAACIVHLDGGCDPHRYRLIFDGLQKYGAKWDMIGLSVYPYWDIRARLTKSEDETLVRAIDNMNALYEKYNTPLMIVETGYDADLPEAGKQWLRRLIEAARTQTDGHCKGVFYWAPELEGHYRLGAFRNHRPTVIMDAFREASVPQVQWDAKSLIIDGKRVVPAMGEVHYSRIPADEWQQEVRKMKEGGITIIACYVFWNHIEELEGQFDWSGQRDLRRFLEICQKEELPVVLRMGPFCHGEVRCGGIPDWLFTKGCKSRSEDPVFLKYVERLYRQIYSQVQGLQWKDGGPVIAAQFDNEYRGDGSYLLALKRLATGVGFDLPFYTRTGWPELRKPVPYGEMLPLYGDYADGFWDRDTKEATGNYYKAFNFRNYRSSDAIATEQLVYTDQGNKSEKEAYPYFTCELGGGMMTSYHRRVYLYPQDAYSMAVVKLGSGSNLLGYYMYHGGTNPDGKLTYLNEIQKTVATNYNDLPVKTYDFQAPLNEFGQRNPHYYMLRKLHLFMQDYGEMLAPMDAVFPCQQDIPQGDDSHLRWSYREKDGSGFLFINNYERFQNLTAKKNVRLEACGVALPQLTIPAGISCIFPVNVDGIRYATAQIIARRDGKIYLEQIKGIPTEIAIDGKVLKNLKVRGLSKPVYKNIFLLDSETAGRLFLEEQPQQGGSVTDLAFRKVKEAGAPRQITIGSAKVAEGPVDADFEQAAVYIIDLPETHEGLLSVSYRGDCARLYADGKLVDDNFYNGREFQYALHRLPQDCRKLELRILPLQADMPVYFPREADVKSSGEEVKRVVITQ